MKSIILIAAPAAGKGVAAWRVSGYESDRAQGS